LADRYAAGVWDLDGDGIAELLVNEAGEGIVRENGPAIVLSLDGGQETELLRADGERILWYTIKSFPWHVNNASTFYKYHPSILAGWDGHHTAFATRSDAGEGMQRIRLWTYDGSSISEAASVTGPSLQIQGSEAGDGSGSILVRSHFPHGQQGVITLEGMQVVGQHSRRLGRGDGERGVGLTELAGTLVLPRNKDVPLIVTQGFGQQIEALEVPEGQARPRTLWRVSGRGMAGNEGASLAPNEGGYGSVAGFDPFGTGEYHVALAGSGERGGGAIRVVRSDGTELWNREFPVFPEPPLWNNSGVTHWVGGHFRDTQTQDLYAVIRRSNQHTEQAFLLDGQSGDEVWRKREGALYAGCGEPVINEFQSGPSPALASLVDYDGDGLDDILDLANSTFTIYQGTSGDTLFNRWNTHGCPTQEGQYLSELLPERTDAGNLVGMVGPLEAGGPVQVLFGMNGETMARFDLDSSLDWYTPVGEGMPIFVLQVPADLDGDGVMEIVVVGHCGTPGSEIRAYDSGNGQLRWSLADASVCAGEPPISPSAADLDGDGRDEVVFTVQSAMHALAEEGGEGVIRWSARLEGGGSWETRLGAPVIADIDGSGWPAILVNTASGHLYALGGASAAARMAEREIIEGLRGGLCSLVSRLSRKPGC
jgi:outer membrane protein assembly factor BamB